MKQFENPNEVIPKIIELINYEYAYAVYTNTVYAKDDDKFDCDSLQRNYELWTGGRLEAMEDIRKKVNCILEEAL